MITFTCEHCDKPLSVDDTLSGQESTCPHCAQPVVVPTLTLAAPVVSGEAEATRARATAIHEGRSGSKTSAAVSAVPREQYDFLAPAQAADELGRLGPYRVLEVIGAGGMGVVFLAEDPALERKVALKAMLPVLAASESARQRFLREARTAAAIEHDHIVAIHQVGEDRGVPFIAMPLLKGESLEARLRRNPPLSLAEAVRIGKEIAVGLAAAHAQGLIHRDIKPANVWLESRQGDRETRRQGDQKARAVSPCLPVSLSPGLPSKFRVKILDFGLARAAGDKGNVTHSGAIMGTPAYMAPEQASGRAVDARTDLFSLGCVLYRLCTGTMPFHGPDAISTLMAVTHHQPPPPSELNRALPRSLSDLIMALLAKDPQARPQSADDVAAALGDMERHVPAGGEYVPEVPVQAPGTHADTQSSVRADTAALRAPLPVKRGLSRRWLTVAAILVTLIGLSIILVPLLTRSSNGDAVMRSSTPDSNVSSRDSSSASSIPSSPGKSASSSEMRSSSEPPAADDRTVALWCVEHGCSIIMGNDKDNFVPCDKSDDLRPLDASFHIVALVTHAPFKVDDKNLEQFAGLSRLEQLMLNTQPITDTGIANLRGCRRLGTLGIFSCKVSDDCFRLIAEQFPELSFLEVSNSEVTGAGLAHLKKMKKLKQLHLGFIPSLKEAELVHLQGLETLEHLGLNQIALTNAGLALLKDLPGLKRLDIQMTQIKDDGLEPLLHLPQLEELVVAYTLVTNDGLKTLVRIPGLTNLSLAGTRVDNDGLAALRDLKNLKTLYLLDLRIKDTGVASIRDLPGLAHLYLSGTDVTDDCLPHLQGMKSLKSVVLTRTKITPAGAKRIKEALAPQVEVFADGLP